MLTQPLTQKTELTKISRCGAHYRFLFACEKYPEFEATFQLRDAQDAKMIARSEMKMK
jgi:hypothetical protein